MQFTPKGAAYVPGVVEGQGELEATKAQRGAEGTLLGKGEPNAVQQEVAGVEQMDKILNDMDANIEILKDEGAIVNQDQKPIERIGSMARSLPGVRDIETAYGSKAGNARANIQKAASLALNAIRNANSLSARAMDSNRELEFYLNALATGNEPYEQQKLAIKRVKDTQQKILTVLKSNPQLQKEFAMGDPNAAAHLESLLYGGKGWNAPETGAAKPPMEGARKAPDGNWYVPDPQRAGKYLQVK